MKIGLELVTKFKLTINPNHFFRMELYAGNSLLPLSAGTDEYNCNCSIQPDKILAATGRRSIVQMNTGPEAAEAKEAIPVPVTRGKLPNLKLRLVNSLIFDQAELKHNYILRLKIDKKTVDLALARPDIKVYWESRGEFHILLGEHVNSN